MVGPTVFGSRHCTNVVVGMNFVPSVGDTFCTFVGSTNGPKVALTDGPIAAPTPTILNCPSQKLLGPTRLANKREKGLFKH